MAAGIVLPPFEFYKASAILEEHKMFVRDFNQNWYQTGLPDVTNDLCSTAEFIKNEIKQINPRKVFLVGNSMGGYAAILFSKLIYQGQVIAFAPQTFISPFLRFIHGDHRWKSQIRKTYVSSLLKRKIWNLRPLLEKNDDENNVSIFVSASDRLDCAHAYHVKDINGVYVYEFSEGGHNVVTLIRELGLLPTVMSGNYA